MKKKFQHLWTQLYKDRHENERNEFLNYLESIQVVNKSEISPYRGGLTYMCYPTHFGKTFRGLREKLPYLKELKVNTLWLLPFLESPFREGGFDPSDFNKLSNAMGGESGFKSFADVAHKEGFRIIADFPISHSSTEHPWFIEARISPNAKNRWHYYWSKNTKVLKEMIVPKWDAPEDPWSFNPSTGDYFLTSRSADCPEINLHNPEVFLHIARALIHFAQLPIDAIHIPWVGEWWKKGSTKCLHNKENKTILELLKISMELAGIQKPLIVSPPGSFGKALSYHSGSRAQELALDLPTQKLLRPLFIKTHTTPEKWAKELKKLFLLLYKNRKKNPYSFLQREENRRPELNQWGNTRLWNQVEGEINMLILLNALLYSLPGAPIIFFGNEIGQGKLENNTNGLCSPLDEDRLRKSRFDKTDPRNTLFSSTISLGKLRERDLDMLKLKPKIKIKGTLLFVIRKRKKEYLYQIFNLRNKAVSYKEIELGSYGFHWKKTEVKL